MIKQENYIDNVRNINKPLFEPNIRLHCSVKV